MKIGITSLYYNSINYGGLLQAYALTRVLNNRDVDAEQIQIQRLFLPTPHKHSFKDYLIPRNYFNKLKYIITPYYKRFFEIQHRKEWHIRRQSIEHFRGSIPHSERVYTDDDIKESNACYDIFITGSDQVWGIVHSEKHPYLLNFVEAGKRKYSYAASMGYSKIDEISNKIYCESLKLFDAISVRELDAVRMLQPLSDKPIVQCVDPTLLLSKKEWDEITRDRIIREKYLLCYFLGDDIKLRRIAKAYAKKKNLKIVTFPHCPEMHHYSDIGFGDYRVFDADPIDFLTYIKFADSVFTDSYHGSIFSIIFEKNFFVFNRKGEDRMISRITSLMEMFGTEDRFFQSSTSIGQLLQRQHKKVRFDNYEILKEKSLDYLTEIYKY